MWNRPYSYEQAAAAPLAGITALQGLRDGGDIRAGQTVLINGASGAVGTSAALTWLQQVRAWGAQALQIGGTAYPVLGIYEMNMVLLAPGQEFHRLARQG